MLTNNDQLHEALDQLNATAQKGPLRETTFRHTAVYEGQVPTEVPIFLWMDALRRDVEAARHLAAQILTTGWD